MRRIKTGIIVSLIVLGSFLSSGWVNVDEIGGLVLQPVAF